MYIYTLERMLWWFTQCAPIDGLCFSLFNAQLYNVLLETEHTMYYTK